MRYIALLSLLACTTGASVEDENGTDSSAADTGTTGDSGTTDSDSNDPGVTQSYEARYTDGPEANWRVGTYLVHFDDQGFLFLRETNSVAATAWPTTFDVTVRGADLQPNGDGTNSAYWLIFAYADANGDDSYNEGEAIDGLSSRLLGYIDESQGAPDVFFGIEFTDQGGADYFAATDGFDLSSVGGSSSLTLAGTTEWSGNPNGEPDRVASISQSEFSGGGLSAGRPLDQALVSPFSWTFSGDPDPARIITDQGFSYAVEVPYGYVDEDGSGDYSDGDTPTSALCDNGDPIYLVWTPSASGIEGATYAVFYGLGAGWTAYASGANEERELTDTSALLMSPTACGF